MAISVCAVSITESSLELPESPRDPEAGAVVVFWGAVRGTENDREISGIQYEAHREMAEHQMRLLAEKAGEKFETREVFIRHRVGFVPAAEPSIVVRVTAGHRGPAFTAAQWIMDELKRVVPIWKQPVFSVSVASPQPAERKSGVRT